MREKDTSPIKATESGRLYIETADFFNIPKIRQTIRQLLESDLVKEIDNRNKKPRQGPEHTL